MRLLRPYLLKPARLYPWKDHVVDSLNWLSPTKGKNIRALSERLVNEFEVWYPDMDALESHQVWT